MKHKTRRGSRDEQEANNSKRPCLRWTKEEDERLSQGVEIFGVKRWKQISDYVETKTPGQCNQHWNRVLSPAIKKDNWTNKEIETLLHRVKNFGANWVLVAEGLPGRTDCSCRQKWVTLNKNKGLPTRRVLAVPARKKDECETLFNPDDAAGHLECLSPNSVPSPRTVSRAKSLGFRCKNSVSTSSCSSGRSNSKRDTGVGSRQRAKVWEPESEVEDDYETSDTDSVVEDMVESTDETPLEVEQEVMHSSPPEEGRASVTPHAEEVQKNVAVGSEEGTSNVDSKTEADALKALISVASVVLEDHQNCGVVNNECARNSRKRSIDMQASSTKQVPASSKKQRTEEASSPMAGYERVKEEISGTKIHEGQPSQNPSFCHARASPFSTVVNKPPRNSASSSRWPEDSIEAGALAQTPAGTMLYKLRGLSL